MSLLVASGKLHRSLECLQRRVADVMLDTLRIAFRGLFINSEAQEKRHNDPVAPSTGLRQLLPCTSEEYRAVRFPADQASSLEPRDVLGHRRRLHSKPLCDIDRSGLSASLDQFSDQFDVVLRHLALVRLTHGRKSFGLRLGSPIDSFKGFTLM